MIRLNVLFYGNLMILYTYFILLQDYDLRCKILSNLCFVIFEMKSLNIGQVVTDITAGL